MDIEQTVASIRDTGDLVNILSAIDIGSSDVVQLLISLLAAKPHIFDTKVYESVSLYYERSSTSVEGFINPNNLKLLSISSNSRTTWLKYEVLLCHLIKTKQLTSKTLAEEILATIKHDLDRNILASVSSVLRSCVERCQKVNSKDARDEDQEKWCEILDWLAWFCSSNDDEFD